MTCAKTQGFLAKAKIDTIEQVDAKKPDRATLLGLLLGPSGNLRAPTLRKGRTLLVGFDEPTYRAILK